MKIKPELYLPEIKQMFYDNNLYSLENYKNDGGNVEVRNSSLDLKRKINDGEKYSYISISESGRGIYTLSNIKRGWEVKQIDRAKQFALKDNIYIPYLLGSSESFFYFSEDKKNVIVTSGMFGIYIEDEKIRLSFYKFLYSKQYIHQFNALSTGHIQTCITQERIFDFKFALLSDSELLKTRKLIKGIDDFIETKDTYNYELEY